MDQNEKKLGVFALAALVVSAMIGGGIFSLPQNMAQSASPAAVIVAWLITGCGIFFLANSFRILSSAKPEAATGIYAYARLGFGRFAGFQMAWCYWLCNIAGNVAYAVLLMDALNYFFPGVFTGGNGIWSILGGSIVIWVMNYAVLRGVRQATFINMLGTICKLVPIFLFILIMLFVFHMPTFELELTSGPAGADFGDQIKNSMLVTLWAFIGIEGAVVISGKAKSQKAVGRATVLGFLCCLIIYMLLSLLPFGVMSRASMATLDNPSAAPLLAHVVGHWGGVVMNLGVIIALLTSWLAFTIMIAQIPYAAAQDGTFPKIFTRENGQGSPSVSLWVTSGIMQLAMILVYFQNNAWNTMLSVTSVMILPPYLASTAYLWKLCTTNELRNNPFAYFCGVAGTLYAFWMIYAAGLKYLLMAFVFLVIGIPFYIYARMERCINDEEPVFEKHEKHAAIIMAVIAMVAVALFATGVVKL